MMELDEIAYCREAMHRAMKERKLNYLSWSKLAGGAPSEATIRQFIQGSAPNISIDRLEKLAHCIGLTVADFLPTRGDMLSIYKRQLIDRARLLTDAEAERVLQALPGLFGPTEDIPDPEGPKRQKR